MSAPEPSTVRTALSGLTTRGRSFLTAGVACAVIAVLFGQRDILRVAVLLAALPLAAAWVVSRGRYRLTCERSLEPMRVNAGSIATVGLELHNDSRLATGLLLVEDRVPYVLGSRPRFVLDRVEPHGSRTVRYSVRSDVRGRYQLGPLSVRLTDPFGMCELTRSFSDSHELTVAPVVTPLGPVAVAGLRGGAGDASARALAAAGEDDVTTREYRLGDPLHRVHWRSTARRGELMVRREESPSQSRATVVLDVRAGAYRGEGPGSSFETAVAAAASVCVHLVRRGYVLRLVTSDGVELTETERLLGGDSEGLLLDALAVIEPTPPSPKDRDGGLSSLGATIRQGRDGVVVLILAAASSAQSADLHALGGVAPYVRTGLAVVVDVASWAAPGPDSRVAGTTATVALLAAAGWRTVTVGMGGDLGAAWAGSLTDAPMSTGTIAAGVA